MNGDLSGSRSLLLQILMHPLNPPWAEVRCSCRRWTLSWPSSPASSPPSFPCPSSPQVFAFVSLPCCEALVTGDGGTSITTNCWLCPTSGGSLIRGEAVARSMRSPAEQSLTRPRNSVAMLAR
jgi:hypothetical protein